MVETELIDRLFKALSLISLAFGSVFSVSANEYKFEDIKFDQVETKQDIYEPKDKLDEYIIKGATYSTKFVPLMNDGAEGSEYTSIITSDFKRLLVDAGFDLANSTANSQIQKIPFFAHQSSKYTLNSSQMGLLHKLRSFHRDDKQLLLIQVANLQFFRLKCQNEGKDSAFYRLKRCLC